MKVKTLPCNISEEIRKEISKRLAENCKNRKTQIDKAKYTIAKTLAEKLSQLGWVKRIYYTEISSGEFARGRERRGGDIDLAVIVDEGKVPPNGQGSPNLYAEALEEELERLVLEALGELGEDCAKLREIAERHGLIELHVNDIYAKLIERKEKAGRISDTGAVRLYPQP